MKPFSRVLSSTSLALALIILGVVAFWWLGSRDSESTTVSDHGEDAATAATVTSSPAPKAPARQIKFTKGNKEVIPAIDLRKSELAPKLTPERLTALAHLKKAIPGVQVSFDPISSAPSHVQATGRMLTPPVDGEVKPLEIVDQFILTNAQLFGHSVAQVKDARVTREDVAKHNGMTTLVLNQQLDGIPVFKTILRASVTKRGEIITLGDHFISDPATASGKQPALRAQLIAQPQVTVAKAISLAAASLNDVVPVEAVAAKGVPAGRERKQTFTAPGQSDTTAQLTWMPMSASSILLAWDVVSMSHSHKAMFRTLVDAVSGRVLYRASLTNSISDASYRVYADATTKQPRKSPTPMSPTLSTPGSAQGSVVTRSLITLDALDTTASPNGWINDGAQETQGNNVDAHTDIDGDDIADSPRPNGGMGRSFDFALDLAQSPSQYKSAAVTNLFYVNNWMHDRLYQLGFTESAGNFQLSNFSRGGLGNDAVQADAQDGSGTNNANFSTPPDGSSGRMQMFVFTGSSPDIDGDLDTEIVLHEYTHGLSNRLVGGGVGIGELQSAGMGEGWSDFYALALLSTASDDVNANYAAGAYATKDFFGGTQNYYFGIRRYPYSTNLAKSPLTFKDIDPAQASSHPGVPVNALFVGDPSEVHSQGEVWCVTLWDMRANLIGKHGFTVGNELTLQLVTDGMKLSPVNPNFIQARDAIIQADLVDNAGANLPQIWNAFAKRGMGANASSPMSGTTSGVVESYDLPDALAVSPTGGVLATGEVGGPFTPSATTITLHNSDTATLSWTASSSEPWLTLSSGGGNLLSSDSTTLTAAITAEANLFPMGTYSATLTFTNTTSGMVQTRVFTLRVGQNDYFAQFFDTEQNDVSHQSFLFTPDSSPSHYRVTREPVTAFPSDPVGGDVQELGDDVFVEVPLTSGHQVSLYGVSYSSVFVGSNGYITLGTGDSSLSQAPESFFALPRVAALMTDLWSPTATTKEFADRIAITWRKFLSTRCQTPIVSKSSCSSTGGSASPVSVLRLLSELLVCRQGMVSLLILWRATSVPTRRSFCVSLFLRPRPKAMECLLRRGWCPSQRQSRHH